MNKQVIEKARLLYKHCGTTNQLVVMLGEMITMSEQYENELRNKDALIVEMSDKLRIVLDVMTDEQVYICRKKFDSMGLSK